MERKVINKLMMLSLVSLFTLCASVTSANAQLSNPIRVQIPFDFNIGDKKLPTGEYIFSRASAVSGDGLMSVSSVDTSAHLFQSTYAAQVLTPKNRSTLVFHKYGDQYFLEQIWSGGEQEGSQLPESRGERIAKRQLAQNLKSNMSGKTIRAETVDVVASLF